MKSANCPIGIFDSGVGGLTVASAVRSLLPGEEMIYFGDTAHLPYGDKSRETIIQYSLSISEFLLSKNCKVILIACNTASSNAFGEIKDYVGDRAIVMNVIDPVVDWIAGESDIKNLGVIGTKATINSETYTTKINQINKSIQVSELATPLFVPMIEEGFIFDDISNAIIRSYLSKRELEGIDTLVLGCTHYPIIKNQISRFFNFRVNVVDSGKIVAEKLKDELMKHGLMNNTRSSDHQFFVSDRTSNFETIARMFFGDKINLMKINI